MIFFSFSPRSKEPDPYGSDRSFRSVRESKTKTRSGKRNQEENTNYEEKSKSSLEPKIPIVSTQQFYL